MAKKRRKKRMYKKQPVKKAKPYKTAMLILVMLAAAALGVWFALSPTLEKNRMLERQSELLDSIENGDGVIVIDEAFADAEMDFYDENGEDSLSTSLESAALPSADAEGVTSADSVVTGIGVLTIERIGARLPVTEGVSTAQLKVAVGHVPQTPEIGETGNAVIAGHRSYTYGQFFNRLGEMEIGDIISYQPKDGETMEFEVFEILEVLPGDAAALWQPEDEQMLTLLTCTPIRTASHRLLVRARLII